MIEAELSDGTILEFPEGTDQAVIQSTVKKMIGGQPKKSLLDKAMDVVKYTGAGVPGGIATTMGAEGLKKIGELVDTGAYAAGGSVTDLATKVSGKHSLLNPLGLNISPEVAAALGYGTNVAIQAAPTILGGEIAKVGAAPAMKATSQSLMKSALKPSSKDILSGDAGKAIETLLKENANVSVAGATKLRGEINKLSAEVAKRIAESPATVDKAHAMSEVYKTLLKFRNQVNPGADTKAILRSWEEFNRTVSSKIPIQEAQALKQGTYKVLADKYAKMGAVENEAATQAQMGMARGLRKGIEEAIPEVGKLNAKESSLINALELSEKRAGISGNRDIGGIAWLANHPGAAAAMMADRSSAFKSWLANRIYQSRNALPRAVGSGTVGAYEAARQNEEINQ